VIGVYLLAMAIGLIGFGLFLVGLVVPSHTASNVLFVLAGLSLILASGTALLAI
jgi:hypothetical protein